MENINVSSYSDLTFRKISKKKDTWILESYITKGGYGHIFNIKRKNDKNEYIIKIENKTDKAIMTEITVYLLSLLYIGKINILPLIEYNLDITVENIPQGNTVLPKMKHNLGSIIYDFDTNHFSTNYLNIFAQKIINVLEFLNNLSLVHNDIKPENIVFDYLWEPYLIDFGMVKNFKIYTKNKFMGTAIYMSCESHQGILSQSSDLISFGFILYLILEKKNFPWTSDKILNKHNDNLSDYIKMYPSKDVDYIFELFIEPDLINLKKEFLENKDNEYFSNPILINYFKLIQLKKYNENPLFNKIKDLFLY